MNDPDPMIALVEFILGQTGMANRLLATHVDDGSGRCTVCSIGGQAGHHRWPCTIHYYAAQASEVERRDRDRRRST